MEYSDYLEVLPDDIIKKLNKDYGTRKVSSLSNSEEINKIMKDYTSRLYGLISKSSAYFNVYKNPKIKVSNCCSVNNSHKEIIKSMGCCDDFNIYDGYLVPRYLNMDRCYCDHYNCEMDILKILLILLGLKSLAERDKIAQMAIERIEIINSLVLQK